MRNANLQCFTWKKQSSWDVIKESALKDFAKFTGFQDSAVVSTWVFPFEFRKIFKNTFVRKPLVVAPDLIHFRSSGSTTHDVPWCLLITFPLWNIWTVFDAILQDLQWKRSDRTFKNLYFWGYSKSVQCQLNRLLTFTYIYHFITLLANKYVY